MGTRKACYGKRIGAAAAMAGLLGACTGGVHVSQPAVTIIHEVEVNDHAWSANVIGPIRPGDRLRIRGSITEWGPDLLDGFAFFSETPLDLRFTLAADDPFADLDLCVFDPPSGQFTLCFASAAQPEVGVFTLPAGVDFHLVVESFAGASAYWLDIEIGHASSYAALHAAGQGGEQRSSARRERYAERPAAEAVEEQTLLFEGQLIEVDEQGEVRVTPLLLRPL